MLLTTPWACAACTTRSPSPTTSRWPGGWLDHAFGPLGLPRVISITDRPNLRSLAVMRRLGMEFDHEAEIEDMGQVFQAVVYSITAERWRSARQR